MAADAIAAIKEADASLTIERYTVPGFKDLPVAAKLLLEKYKCDIVLALGWVGGAPVDEVCAHEASQGLIQVQLLTNKHVLGAFLHTSEAPNDEKKLVSIARDRARKHALNCVALLKGKTELTPNAGKGVRQGNDNEGALT